MTPEQRRQWIRTVLGCADLTPAHKNVLIALETFADYRDGSNARPGEALLAEVCGLSVRAVRYGLDRGQELGLIVRTARANPKRGLAAVYRLALHGSTGTGVPVNEPSSTGTTVPVNQVSTGTVVPLERGSTGTPTHFNRHGHDTSTGTTVPPTSPVPSNHQGVVTNSGTSPGPLPTHTDPPPSRFCDNHPHGYRGKCGDCANARTAFNTWQAAAAEHDVEIAATADADRRRRAEVRENCPHCDGLGRIDTSTDPDAARYVRCPSCNPAQPEGNRRWLTVV